MSTLTPTSRVSRPVSSARAAALAWIHRTEPSGCRIRNWTSYGVPPVAALSRAAETATRSSGTTRWRNRANPPSPADGTPKMAAEVSDQRPRPVPTSHSQVPIRAASSASWSRFSLVRARSSAAARSRVIAARVMSGMATTIRKDCIASTLAAGVSPAKGPLPATAPVTASSATSSRLALVAAGPNRTAAQSRNGSGAYSSAGLVLVKGPARVNTRRHTSVSITASTAASSGARAPQPAKPSTPRLAPGDDQRDEGELGEQVGKESHAPVVPVAGRPPAVQLHEPRVEKAGDEDARGRGEQEDPHSPEGVEPRRPASQHQDHRRADQRLAGVAEEPAEDHGKRNPRPELDQQVSGKRAQQDDPPAALGGEEQQAEEDGVGWPQRGDRLGTHGERHAQLGGEQVRHACQHGRDGGPIPARDGGYGNRGGFVGG